jgi:uncharacterized protein (DUF1499 family)
MARRLAAPYHAEPRSALALWSRHLALFALLATIFSIIVVRFGFLELRPAVMTFAGALALAGLSIFVAVLAFIAIWRNGSRGFGAIALALFIDAAILAYPAYLAMLYQRLPAIHDISTDVIDPPRFEVLARLRAGDGANPAAYAGLYSAEQQRIAYPDIEPLILETTPQKAYDAVLDIITKRKWLVVDARPPQGRRPGHIEAIARTLVMGFRDDIVVRVSTDGEGARIDLRSSSRFLEHDFGDNAARIRRLVTDINETVEDAPEPVITATPAKKGPQAKGQSKR